MRLAFLEAGRVRNTHALKGEVKFESWLETSAVLRTGVFLYADRKGEKGWKIKSVRGGGENVFIVSFDGIDTPEAASKLKARTLYIRREDLDPAGDKVFFDELINLPLIEEATGERYGLITAVTSRGGGELFLVKLSDGREEYFPASRPFLKQLDPEKAVYVEAPKGIFDK